MTEQTENQEEMNPVDRSVDLYQDEQIATVTADELARSYEFNGEEPSVKELGQMTRAEEAREQTREASDNFAQQHIDEIHEAAIAEAAKRVAEIYENSEDDSG